MARRAGQRHPRHDACIEARSAVRYLHQDWMRRAAWAADTVRGIDSAPVEPSPAWLCMPSRMSIPLHGLTPITTV